MKDAMDSKRQAALVWLSLSPEAKQVMQDRLGDFPEEVRLLAEELNAIESASREERLPALGVHQAGACGAGDERSAR